ncbi:outer membrane adhesin/peptidase omptin [Lucifera butyrica]|uniref:Outer membrane adhesin/peptidase omptin n=1 Tax=Lucifera butyrica TaxID=1351585 RepID=A0A498R2Y8_9FIRM|nr:hypothetical protein [Lucifera butyrica]VBB05140.1 outer membrane adhesin/peptidase omptin [Lucifera butyrica]
MSKKIFCLLLFLLLFTGSIPIVLAAATYDFSIGTRKDDASWNFAGDTNGENPNIQSELKWTNLRIKEAKLKWRNDIDNNSFWEGSAGYGWIYSGQSEDSDYAGDNRTGMYSRSISNSGNGHVVDVTLGYGYYIDKQEKSKIALIAGYAVNKQYMVMTDGNQIYSDGVYQTQPLGPFDGLNSTYNARWNGPYFGIDIEHQANKKLNWFTRLEYHFAEYHGECNWNLQPALAHPKSFEQIADGSGTVLTMGVKYKMDRDWTLQTKVSFSRFNTDTGIFRAYLADGTSAETQLNEADWNSRSISLSITKKF